LIIKVFENDENRLQDEVFCRQGEQSGSRGMESPGKSGKKALAIFGKLEYNRCRKEGKEIKNMKVQNIKDVNKFFEVVDNCAGKVELVTGEGDRLNLKSKLCQYVSLANIFSNGEIPELEIIAYEKEDIDKLLSFMING
jgi:hypothetical protein